MWDNKLRGIVLKTLYDLDTISPIYHRVDMLQIVCGLPEEDFDGIVQQLTDEGIINKEQQRSYIIGNSMSALKISQLGIDIVNGTTESPIPIQIESELTL